MRSGGLLTKKLNRNDMTKAEEIFNVKAEYNKWLKELTDDEKELVLEMINEAFRQCNVVGQSEQLRTFARWYEENYQFEISDRVIQEYERYGS